MKKPLTLFVAAVLFVVISFAPAYAQSDGQVYVVRRGDWLSKIAQTFYGNAQDYQRIIDATNEKAKTDSTFFGITDPNRIETGQKLWLPNPTDAELTAAYKAAVQDAVVADASELSRDLIAIVPSQPSLKWQGEGADQRVLVVTWTSFNGYDANVGKPMTLTREVWVTAVPEVRDFCDADARPAAEMVLRMEQMLGLPPHNGKTKYVEMWVKPADLYRPSPDPEITDHEAELEFRNTKQLTTSEDFIKWFDALKNTSYGENGYPWTRMGYTYDWGNPHTRVGMSEFVINPNADVIINAVTANEAYCQ